MPSTHLSGREWTGGRQSLTARFGDHAERSSTRPLGSSTAPDQGKRCGGRVARPPQHQKCALTRENAPPSTRLPYGVVVLVDATDHPGAALVDAPGGRAPRTTTPTTPEETPR